MRAVPAHRVFEPTRRAAIAQTIVAMGGLTLLPSLARSADRGALAAPVRAGGMPLAEALATRRSVRRYGPRALTLPELSQLLWAAQGHSAPGRRTAPSAGALYPLELLLVAARVDGLGSGVHRYLPAVHALQRTSGTATLPMLQGTALGQAAVGEAAAVFVIAAVEARSAGKYGSRAARYAAFEAGAAAQNLALQAVALGLGSVVIGGFDDLALANSLQLGNGEQPIVMMPVGELP